jgi:hypothetical protein
MSSIKPYHVVVFLLLIVVSIMVSTSTQSVTGTIQDQKDSSRTATVEEMAKRVDSLQFIVVYNAELLRRDLDSKMVLIYVMLGVIIIASMLLYALLKQNQRQRTELAERLTQQLSTAVGDMEGKIKNIQSQLTPPAKAPVKKAAPGKKRK